MLFLFSFFIGGEYEFSCDVERNFYDIYKNEDGKNTIKEGWTSKLNMVIWNKLHLPCCLGFRRVKYRSTDIKTSDGYCRQKDCLIKITSILPHHSKKLTVTIENYKPNIFHEEKFKRRMLPCEQKALSEKLKGKSAYAVRSEIADEILTEEYCNSAAIPSLNALNVLKSRHQSTSAEKNAVLSMYGLRDIHVDCIQQIDLYPFATHYSTPSQISWYKNEFRNKRRSTISFDASGVGVVSPTDLKKNIYLYVICGQGKHRDIR